MNPSRPSPKTESDLAALRDATDIVARSTADEADAIDARERYRSDGLPAINADPDIGSRLRPGERVVEIRPAALVGRAMFAGSAKGAGGASGPVEVLSGRLYLTTSRFVLLTRSAPDETAVTELAVELGEIEELALVAERLLVSLADGTGLTIDAGRPRLLRVQIAAARAASRDEGLPAEPDRAPAFDALGLGMATPALEPRA